MTRKFRSRLFVRCLDDRTAPATFTALNLNDSGADSLRDCISKANAAAGADTVDFKSGLSGTITLTTGEIAISQAVTISGPGANVMTISGNNASRIFNTDPAPNTALITISGLTLTAGKSPSIAGGGAIFGGNEQLTLNDCVLTGNSSPFSGGAVQMSGAILQATNCSFTNNNGFY